jgi:hypothetical protein
VIRKVLLVAVIVLCFAAAVLLTAGRPGKPALYVGYWRIADEAQTDGRPLLIRVAGEGEHATVTGLKDTTNVYHVYQATPSLLVLRIPDPTSAGNYYDLRFDVSSDGATMTVVNVYVEDPGTAGVPRQTLSFVRATEPDDQLAAELAAELAEQNRPPEEIIKEGGQVIADAVEKWARTHHGTYPPLQSVIPGSTDLTPLMKDGWPVNPLNGAPMEYSSQPGDYNYSTDGKSYHLILFMPDGSTYTAH